MTLGELLSTVIFAIFGFLVLVGVVSTGFRWFRYLRLGLPVPVLLKRDTVLLSGLAVPFVLIAAVRALGLTATVTGEDGPQVWWLLVTGIPPILAMATFCYYEIFVVERDRSDSRPETTIEREDREVGDTRRDLQRRNHTEPE